MSTDVVKGATICGEYRMSLWRIWDVALPRLAVIMLNPSTADGKVDDRTICRLYSFARREGFGSFEVVNLFSLRSTDPKALKHHLEPVGAGNDLHVQVACNGADLILCAWGANAPRERAEAIKAVLRRRWKPDMTPVKCLGLTKAGHPRHPLYCRSDTPLVDYPL